MSVYAAKELTLRVQCKIVTYYPSTVVENQTKLMRKINEALANAGKEMDFLASPVTVMIEGS